ncbi:MAG: cellulose synthase operon protein YhjQ/BcsQ [Bryobacterales bacterium]
MEAAADLLARITPDRTMDAPASDWDALPRANSLTMAGVTGGAGVTTLLANVASVLSKRGERVVVADRGPSLLPFYFGGRNFRSAPTSFVPQLGAGEGPVHLVTGPADAASDDWLQLGMREFRGDCDRVLIHCRGGLSAEASRWAWEASAAIFVLTPDPASLLRLPHALERARSTAERQVAPVLLLNQFDPASELHAEVRFALSSRFAERLLPFVIRRDEAFARCLAAGGVATELAPDSDASQDIHALVDWLVNQHSAPEI